jgi:hypothetical protein
VDSHNYGQSTAVMGHQSPRILHLPASEPSLAHVGKGAVALAALAGLELDPWQSDVLSDACGKRNVPVWNPITDQFEYKWAAREVGLMISRQNGKGSILEARELAGLFLFGERVIIHSAHQFDTSRKHFNRIIALIEGCPEFDDEIARISRSHGEECIETKSGQTLEFRTRTKSGGRGFTGDLLVLDEAMILDSEMIGALMPTLSARPNVQIWYTGSAGTKTSTQFGRIRSRALKCAHNGCPCMDPLLYYAEWSAELCNFLCGPGCQDHDDPAAETTWAKANAAYGIRIDAEACESERRTMDPDMYAQERLGVGDWPVDGEAWLVIPKDYWNARIDHSSILTGKFCLAIDTAPDRAMTCITAAGGNGRDGEVHVEVTGNDQTGFDYHQGINWAVERVKHIWDTQRPEFVVVDPSSPAGTLIPELEAYGIKVLTPMSREYAQACGDFAYGVAPRRGEKAFINHVDQQALTDAVAAADKRDLADLWAWSKSLSAKDICPLGSATLAVWGYKMHIYTQKTADPWVFFDD